MGVSNVLLSELDKTQEREFKKEITQSGDF